MASERLHRLWQSPHQLPPTALNLPVEDVLPALRQSLARDRRAVLQAPPGAGKTTLVPLAMLDAGWLGSNRIVMLEPRRVAARAAAHRMAELHGDAVGTTIGFRTRTESRIGRETRIEVVTEGILTRRLQRDPTLDGVGLVIFDEFHERSLVADLGLALTLHSRRLVRDDLRLLVMSATLDTASVARLLDDAPIISAEGRVFPVATRYAPPRDPRALEAAVAGTVRRALSEDPGDVLVFLPGAAEISRVRDAIGASGDVEVLALHGSLASDEQDRAIRAANRRRVVLATSIAETSLTIPGVRVVVDSGLARRPRFSPSTGMTRLETLRVSRATADQRRGRAGRIDTGVCYRLWDEHEPLSAAAAPEILEADLAPLALDLAAAGITDPSDLSWMDDPPRGAFEAARRVLRELELLDANGRTTAAGARAAGMPVHPRLAHMMLRAKSPTARRMAAALAAMLDERDMIRFAGHDRDPDARLRLEILEGRRRAADTALPAGAAIMRDVVQRVSREAQRLTDAMSRDGDTKGDIDEADPGTLLALAYPDRVAMKRSGQRGRYLTRDGVDVSVDPGILLANEEFIVAAELDGKRPLSRAWLAAPIERRVVESLFAGDIETVRSVEWQQETGSVSAVEQRRLGAIVLAERATRADPNDIAAAMLGVLVQRGVLAREELAEELGRLAFANTIDPRPAFELDPATVAESVAEWLLPSLVGIRTLAAAEKVDLREALLARLDFQERRRLDEIAPTHIVAPTGTRVPVDYRDPKAPSAAVRIQELFGLADTPRVGFGRVPLTLHLLSPARRPVQVTRDLAGFWKNSYFEVRKDLRGRYPRHPWPDDPASAAPTRRAKPR
jgi:ATP-dependent helicase HrpB